LYISAAGHFGKQSSTLVRDYAQNLGFKYLTASTKEEFLANIDKFLNPDISQSYIFEVFTQDVNESEALKLMKINGLKDTIQERMKDMGMDVIVYKAKDKISKLFK